MADRDRFAYVRTAAVVQSTYSCSCCYSSPAVSTRVNTCECIRRLLSCTTRASTILVSIFFLSFSGFVWTSFVRQEACQVPTVERLTTYHRRALQRSRLLSRLSRPSLAVQAPSDKSLDWGKVNVGVAPDVYKNIYKKAVKHYNDNVEKM